MRNYILFQENNRLIRTSQNLAGNPRALSKIYLFNTYSGSTYSNPGITPRATGVNKVGFLKLHYGGGNKQYTSEQ